jgi:hypothetical protein
MFISALEECSRDNLDFVKDKAIKVCVWEAWEHAVLVGRARDKAIKVCVWGALESEKRSTR